MGSRAPRAHRRGQGGWCLELFELRFRVLVFRLRVGIELKLPASKITLDMTEAMTGRLLTLILSIYHSSSFGLEYVVFTPCLIVDNPRLPFRQ